MIEDALQAIGLASVAFTVIVVSSFVFAREVHLPEISRGAVRPSATPQTVFWLGLIVLSVMGSGVAAAAWISVHHDAAFWQLFLVAYGVQVAINLVDLVIIDLAIYTWWYPRFMRFEAYPPLHDTGYHARAALRGISLIGIPFSLVAAAIAMFLGR